MTIEHMTSRVDKLAMMEELELAIESDKAKPQVGQLSDLGLVELTRHRQGQSLAEIFSKKCPHCQGTGYIADDLTFSAPVSEGEFRAKASKLKTSVQQVKNKAQQNNKFNKPVFNTQENEQQSEVKAEEQAENTEVQSEQTENRNNNQNNQNNRKNKFNKNKFIFRKNENNKINSLYKHHYETINIFISKFINVCIINSKKLSKFYSSSDLSFKLDILKIAKLFFFNDFIDEKALELILGLQFFLCRYKEDKKSKNIENASQIYLVIDFLLEFCNNNFYLLNDNKKSQIIHIIDFIVKYMKKNILTNFTDLCLLSRSKSFLKLIGLCQITFFQTQNQIISLLVEVYKYKLNIDFILDDLREKYYLCTVE